MSKALLYDATLCIGCKACEDGCATEHGLPYDANLAAQENTSAYKLTAVVTKGDAHMRRICMNCEDPTCASVCPVGALAKSKLGPVTYDEDKCMGCRYCMVACPFNVPKYEWNKLLPRVRKCDMCSTRVVAGKPTACADICPTGATKFGERDDLLAEARERIKNGNGQYVDHIYGMTEVGGTSVFMLSAVPFETFGYHTPQEPLPDLTYRVLSRIPDVVTLGGVALGGIYWITKRRAEVAAAEGHLAKGKDKKEGERHE